MDTLREKHRKNFEMVKCLFLLVDTAMVNLEEGSVPQQSKVLHRSFPLKRRQTPDLSCIPHIHEASSHSRVTQRNDDTDVLMFLLYHTRGSIKAKVYTHSGHPTLSGNVNHYPNRGIFPSAQLQTNLGMISA